MLKTIEEPPAYGIVLLLAESENSFLPTILSRCVKISLSPLPTHLLCSALIGKGFPEPEAQAAAALVQGSLGDALKLSRDENFSLLRTELFDFLASLPTASPSEVMRGASLFESYKSSRDTLVSLLTIGFRDVSVYRETEDPSLLLIRDRMSAMKAYAETYSSEKILRICETIPDIYTKLQHNVNAALAIDCLLMEMMK